MFVIRREVGDGERATITAPVFTPICPFRNTSLISLSMPPSARSGGKHCCEKHSPVFILVTV